MYVQRQDNILHPTVPSNTMIPVNLCLQKKTKTVQIHLNAVLDKIFSWLCISSTFLKYIFSTISRATLPAECNLIGCNCTFIMSRNTYTLIRIANCSHPHASIFFSYSLTKSVCSNKQH